MITNKYCKCDKCGQVKQFDNWTFEDILKVVRAGGWRVTKNGVVWRHYCADCVRKRNHAKLKPSPASRKTAPAQMWWQRD